MKANQYFVGRVLETGVRLVQFARSLGSELAKLIAVLNVGKRPKNKSERIIFLS